MTRQRTHLVDTIAIDICVTVAAEHGGTMSCEDEGECPAREICGHYAEALMQVAEMQRLESIA